MCEIIPPKKQLHVHHRDGDMHNNSPENLQTLCMSCHMKTHWKQRKSSLIEQQASH
ncbi:MAG: hypothetical protein E6Q97_22880 [Desulfurellales bacterium]|nr:MAG: hypothetical protein E6Q97_22880 [Desulfurellales bacterium]